MKKKSAKIFVRDPSFTTQNYLPGNPELSLGRPLNLGEIIFKAYRKSLHKVPVLHILGAKVGLFPLFVFEDIEK